MEVKKDRIQEPKYTKKIKPKYTEKIIGEIKKQSFFLFQNVFQTKYVK